MTDRLRATPHGCFHRFECQHIIHSLQEKGVRKWVALSEGAGGTVGWLTVRSCHRTIARPQALVDTLSPAPCAQTNERKEAMCFQTRDALRVGNIFLSEGFFSVLMEEREAIKTIQDELCRFAIITEPAKTLFGKVRLCRNHPRTNPC